MRRADHLLTPRLVVGPGRFARRLRWPRPATGLGALTPASSACAQPMKRHRDAVGRRSRSLGGALSESDGRERRLDWVGEPAPHDGRARRSGRRPWNHPAAWEVCPGSDASHPPGVRAERKAAATLGAVSNRTTISRGRSPRPATHRPALPCRCVRCWRPRRRSRSGAVSRSTRSQMS